MRRWLLGLLVFLFLALTVFSLILGRQLKEVEKTHKYLFKKPIAIITPVHPLPRKF